MFEVAADAKGRCRLRFKPLDHKHHFTTAFCAWSLFSASSHTALGSPNNASSGSVNEAHRLSCNTATTIHTKNVRVNFADEAISIAYFMTASRDSNIYATGETPYSHVGRFSSVAQVWDNDSKLNSGQSNPIISVNSDSS